MLRRALMSWILCSSVAYPQSKVGTTGAQFLELPLSARTAGMGNVAVVLVDNRSYQVNPALLAFMDPTRVSLQFDPYVSKLNGDAHEYYSTSAAWCKSSDDGGGPSVGLGGRFESHRLSGCGDCDPIMKDVKAGLAVGLGWSGNVDAGIGVGWNYLREEIYGFVAETGAADLGAFLGVTVHRGDQQGFGLRRILVGAVLSNLGPGFELNGRTHELPHYFRLGLGAELAWQGGGREILRLTPAAEYQNRFGSSTKEFTNIGVEVRLQELLSGRIGLEWLSGEDRDIATWGLGFSTAGLRGRSGGKEAGGRGVLDFFFNDIDLQVSYAHQSPPYEWLDGTDYYGVELMF